MPWKWGRAHGNGYNDHVTQKITFIPSKGFNDLFEYEQAQLAEHPGYINEKDYTLSWIERTCVNPNCNTFENMEKKGDIYVCKNCGCKKIPKEVWEAKEVPELENYGIKIQCPDCGNLFILDPNGEYFCIYCKRIYLDAEIRERCAL